MLLELRGKEGIEAGVWTIDCDDHAVVASFAMEWGAGLVSSVV